MRFALAGNPNSGKTTLFNLLTSSTAHVGNWPGVTVDKRVGVYKKLKEKIDIIDLPGIYSLSPYTDEEIITRNYIVNEKPDCLINIIDATNLERNLYLTTQLLEMDVPIVVALNMMDVVNKEKNYINIKELSNKLGVPVVSISAIKDEGIKELMETSYNIAKEKRSGSTVLTNEPYYDIILKTKDMFVKRNIQSPLFNAVKLVEEDENIISLYPDILDIIKEDKKQYQDNDFGGDFEGMIADARYRYITTNLASVIKKNNKQEELTKSDKIDKVLTHPIWSIPIFLVIMFFIFHLVFSEDLLFINSISKGESGVKGEVAINIFTGMGYEDLYLEELNVTIIEAAEEQEGILSKDEILQNAIIEAATNKNLELSLSGEEILYEDLANLTLEDLEIDDQEAVLNILGKDKDDIDIVIGIPSPGVFLQSWMGFVTDKIIEGGKFLTKYDEDNPSWYAGLICDGILEGLAAVFSFLPQIMLLFLFIALLEDSGYMARVAFIMDRAFRGLGLSGKAFIPLLMGFGCSVPAMMGARTLENEKERDLTIRLTPFFSCGAKAPIWAMLALCVSGSFLGDIFVFSIYLLGIVVAVISALLIKLFSKVDEVPPFIMELPTYHAPQFKNLMAHLWEKLKHFVIKASTIITAAIVLIWFLSSFPFAFWNGMVDIEDSILASICHILKYFFYPLGFTWGADGWKYSVATITGLIAKEDVVATMATLGLEEGLINLSNAQIYAFAAYNLLTFPCFAAISTAKSESSKKGFSITLLWWFASSYVVSLIIFWLLYSYEKILVLGIILTIILITLIVLLFVYSYKRRKKYLNS